MAGAKVFVCERSGDWAVAWRRTLAPLRIRVQETRSLAECVDELTKEPASVVAVDEMLESPERVAAWLADAHERFPRARFVLLAAPAGGEAAWLAREAGATQVIRSRMELPTAAAWIARHLAEFAAPPAESLRERLLVRLPWPRFATSEFTLKPQHES